MPTVILYWSPGRTPEQKQRVVEGITNTLVEHGGARREDVLIIFQNIEPGDAGRGGKMLTPPNLKSTEQSSPGSD
ncbi:MAG: 4-oxalocrotonate tautomerase family protein [Anaerolineae bacterium]|nr:4-oxalocrotonate tautomerase family protein [Anaerolineae bacterium]